MTNIKDVAKRAGVSVASVSNVINGNLGSISEEKRQVVLQVIEEIGYRPNRRVRQLRKQANLTIAVQMDSSVTCSNIWRPAIALDLIVMQGICKQAQERGYNIHIIIPDQGNDIEDISRQVIKENTVDGIILLGLGPALRDSHMEALLQELKKCGLPCVTRDPNIYALGTSYVACDLSLSIKAATARLAELGHRQGAYIGRVDREIIRSCPPRLSLFEACLARYGLAFAEDMVFDDRTECDVYRRILQIAESGSLPTFIIFSSDHLAMAGLEALHDRGIRVPQEVSLISFDNAPYACNARVPLATIDQRFFEQGCVLAQTLLGLIEKKGISSPDMSMVRSDFIERVSLGMARR